ncbi:unnamed protein product, partial [Amoebophrya sp. A25]|eukprot:GSA25T00019646001.1
MVAGGCAPNGAGGGANTSTMGVTHNACSTGRSDAGAQSTNPQHRVPGLGGSATSNTHQSTTSNYTHVGTTTTSSGLQKKCSVDSLCRKLQFEAGNDGDVVGSLHYLSTSASTGSDAGATPMTTQSNSTVSRDAHPVLASSPNFSGFDQIQQKATGPASGNCEMNRPRTLQAAPGSPCLLEFDSPPMRERPKDYVSSPDRLRQACAKASRITSSISAPKVVCVARVPGAVAQLASEFKDLVSEDQMTEVDAASKSRVLGDADANKQVRVPDLDCGSPSPKKTSVRPLPQSGAHGNSEEMKREEKSDPSSHGKQDAGSASQTLQENGDHHEQTRETSTANTATKSKNVGSCEGEIENARSNTSFRVVRNPFEDSVVAEGVTTGDKGKPSACQHKRNRSRCTPPTPVEQDADGQKEKQSRERSRNGTTSRRSGASAAAAWS